MLIHLCLDFQLEVSFTQIQHAKWQAKHLNVVMFQSFLKQSFQNLHQCKAWQVLLKIALRFV